MFCVFVSDGCAIFRCSRCAQRFENSFISVYFLRNSSLHYVPNYYANHVFHDISKNILAKQIKHLKQLRFTMIGLWWTKFDNELFGYDVYAEKVLFPLFQIIMQTVKERIQLKFELTCTINRTACWMHTQMNENQ